MTPPLHHAYNVYLDTLPEEQQTQHIAENLKHALRKERMKQAMRTPQYKAKCHDCKETYQTQNIDHIDQWTAAHERYHCKTTNPIIEVWQTHH